MKVAIGLSLLFAGFLLTAAAVSAQPQDGVIYHWRAGETYRVGYTVLQHGITPFRTNETWIWARPQDGRTLAFPGKEDGAPGHYVADVRFPAAGEWTWEAGAGGFEPQKLGTVSVLPAGQAPVEDSRPPANAAARIALPLATVCAGVLFALQVVSSVRSRMPARRTGRAASVTASAVRGGARRRPSARAGAHSGPAGASARSDGDMTKWLMAKWLMAKHHGLTPMHGLSGWLAISH